MTEPDRSVSRRADQTSTVLRRNIAAGLYDGGALPGERSLAQTLGVSRATLRQSLAELVAEGLLVHRQGLGTFLARGTAAASVQEAGPAPPSSRSEAETRPVARPRTRLEPLVDTGLNGPVTSVREVERGLFPPLAQEALALGLGADERVCRLTRIVLSGGRPVAIERAAAAARLLPDLDWPSPFLLGALAARGLRAARKVCRLRGGELSAADAEALDASPRSAAVEVEEAAFLEDGPCCAFTRATYRADRLDAVLAFDLPAPP